MTKLIACIVALSTPALADPTAPAAKPVRYAFQIKTPAGTRVHELATTGRDCARVFDRDADHEDEIHVCADEQADGIRLSVEWATRGGGAEYKSASTVVVARGHNYELGRPNGVRLAVDVR